MCIAPASDRGCPRPALLRESCRAEGKLHKRTPGRQMIRQQAKWLQVGHADAAASLFEGLDETFTPNKPGPPSSLKHCMYTTSVIENSNGIASTTINRVQRWREQDIALRWCAAGSFEAQKSFRRIDGVMDLSVFGTAFGRKL